MLEVIANIEDDVYAAEKQKRESASASGTDIGRTRKQQVVSNSGEPLIMPEPPVAQPRLPPNPSETPFVPSSPEAPVVVTIYTADATCQCPSVESAVSCTTSCCTVSASCRTAATKQVVPSKTKQAKTGECTAYCYYC